MAKIADIDQFLRARNIKPQHEWQWQVAVYLYLAGIGSGSMAMGILMDWLGYVPDGLRPVILWGPILVAIGALFLVLKLGVMKRFLNTVINPMSSWLSRGFYILSMCIVSGMLILVIALLPYLGSWLGFTINIWPWLITALDIVGFIFALGTGIYTGILIMSVKYVPFWKTLLLPSLFTVSALSTGAMAVTLASQGYNLFADSAAFVSFSNFMADSNIIIPAAGFPEAIETTLASIEQVIVIIEIIVIVLYLVTRYRAGEYAMYSVRLLLNGKYKYIFWIGIVLFGFAIPIPLELIYSRAHEQHILLFIAGAFLLIGGFFVRYAIVYSGIKEEPPMMRIVSERVRLQRKEATGTDA